MKTVKPLCSLLLVLCLVFTCAGCQNEQEALYSQALSSQTDEASEQESMPESALQSSEPGDGLSGTLTIKTASYLKNSSINFLAEEFMQLHPQVKIEFDYELGEAELNSLSRTERNMRRDSYYTQLRLELASGEGDYLLYNVQEKLDLPSVSGLLEDIHEYWDSDPDIDPEEYFTPVLEAFTVGGKIPVLPFSFKYNGMYFSSSILQSLSADAGSIQSVSCDDILDWYEEARKSDPQLNLIFTSPGKDTLFAAEKPRYIDLENKTADFQSPNFIRFLERTAAVSNEDPELDPESEIGISDPELMNEKLRCLDTGADPSVTLGNFAELFGHLVTASRPAFAAQLDVGLAEMAGALHPMEYVAGPYPYTSSDGKLGITSLESFALPVSCKNKDLAWAFMKHCVLPRDSVDFSHMGSRQRYTHDIPLSKTNLRNFLENFAENGVPMMITEPRLDPMDLENTTEVLEQILSMPLVNTGAYGVDLQDYLDEYYINALTTPEQCAEKLQDRVNIWLHE